MLATVTIEAGFETRDEKMKAHQEYQPNKPLHTNSPTSGFQTFTALIDIRRPTNMLEVVKRCKPTITGLDAASLLSDVHFKMLERDCSTMLITPMKSEKEMYRLKCRKHVNRSTGVRHSLTVTVQAISVPRLEDRDVWPN